ncbi:major capsid protein [Acinetobacter junii]|uniref:major capsid protein n=1 Tax=Acinetobacter junii TaxID=40215 RepID=UPI001250C232|nr:major capsid protein [Acinetobacter junii]
MSLSQMQVFNEYIMPATIETLAQMVQKFNAASGGAIRLTTDGFTGDFLQESFFASLDGAQRRVDRYAANGTAPITDLSEIKHSSVKVAGGIGPVRYEPSQMTWLQRPTAQGIEVASRTFASLMLKDQLNTAIAALVAAISNQPDATNDVSATAGLTYSAMNGAHAKFGDHSGNIITDVMNGTAYHKLIEKNLSNAQQLFQSGNVRVIDILGKLVVVTDAPALYTAGTPNQLKVLSLTDAAAIVSDGGDVVSNIETTNGKDRIETTLQVDYSFGVGLKGYTWDEANGGKSPSDAELATGANWDKSATSIKHTAGVITIADAAQ